MTTCILNIGSRCRDGAELTQTALYKAFRGAGLTWERVERIASGGAEDTFVVVVGITDDKVDLLAGWLDQECIAVYDLNHMEGRMVGPEKAKWGEFNPALFYFPNGSLLSDLRSVA